RLALGDDGHRVRLPVTVAVDAVRQLEAHLPTWSSDARPGAAQSANELRQVVRFAQQDPGIAPIGLLSWLRFNGDPLLNLLVALYERGFGEVGRGEGGAETAYLIHLVIVELTRRTVIDAAQDQLAASVILTSMLDAAIAGVLTSNRVNDNHLSPRLGYQLASTRSPLSFGIDADALAARPVNIYRTIPRALQLARRVIQPPVEVIPLDRVAETLAKRMLVEPELRAALLKDILLEMVRDAALIGTMQAYRQTGSDLSFALSEILQSPKMLLQSVFNQGRRGRVLERLEQNIDSGPKAVGALIDLLRGVPAVEQGDTRPLGVHGNLDERALLAARGAICLVLDAHAEDLKRDVNALVQWLDPEEATVAYREGRCYRLGLDARPLYRLPEREREAFLFLDAGELVRRVAERRPAALGDLVSRYLMTPLLDRFAALRTSDEKALRLIHVGPDQAGFAGEITLIIELADAAREVVGRLQRELRRPVADVLGGRSHVMEEADEEIRRLEERILLVDGALRKTPTDDDSVQMLNDSRAMLEKRLAVLSDSRRRMAGAGYDEDVDVGIFVTYGSSAVSVPLPADIVASDGVWFSPLIIESRRGCARVPWVKDDRQTRVALRRRAVGDEAAILPFDLSVRTRDERTAIFNAGCGLSEVALKAYLRARTSVLTYFEVQAELRELPETARRKFVFDRDPERFVLCLGRLDGELVMVFRYVGRHGAMAIWEMLSGQNPFIDVLVSFVPSAQELTG
ncbi:MAG: hypothetical protein AAFV29_04965, partial [Myxococcota bacterium]